MSHAVRTSLLLLALAGAFSACASAQQGSQSVAGCWYFERDAAAETMRLPWGVRLFETRLDGWPVIAARGDVRRASTLQVEAEVDHPFGYWMAVPGDSIEIGYPAGGGIVMMLDRRGDAARMIGTARSLGDALPPSAPRPSARTVSLVRASCPEDA